MAFWSSGNRTPSPNSDMDTDYSDDRTPSPYSDDDSGPLWVETPLVKSRQISARIGLDVYLKMEHFQPSQSFEYRGVSLFIQKAKEKHGRDLHIVSASGSNAALAAACASKSLFLDCTVFITQDTSQDVIEFLKREDAKVVIEGNSYSKVLKKAKAAVAANPNAILVPACDDQVIRNGHGSMIQEIRNKLDFIPDVIFCSVSEGDLLGAVIDECAAGWGHVPIVAIEPVGSNSFYSSMALNSPWKEMHGEEIQGVATDMDIKERKRGLKIAHLRNPRSRVTYPGAASPAPKVVDRAGMRIGGVICVCVPDEMMMSAAVSFADEHKVITELACAVTLTPLYEPGLMDHLWQSAIPAENGLGNAVFILGGGSKASLAEMDEFREILRRDLEAGKTSWECFCNGVPVTFEKAKTNRV